MQHDANTLCGTAEPRGPDRQSHHCDDVVSACTHDAYSVRATEVTVVEGDESEVPRCRHLRYVPGMVTPNCRDEP